MRPDAPHDPAVELVEYPSDVGSLEVLAPSAHYRIDLLNQFRGTDRRSAACKLADLILEAADRLLRRTRVERSGFDTTFDLVVRQPHRPAAALDLVVEKIKSASNVHDPRLAQIELHAQHLQDPTRRLQRHSRLRCGWAGYHPIIRVPRKRSE